MYCPQFPSILPPAAGRGARGQPGRDDSDVRPTPRSYRLEPFVNSRLRRLMMSCATSATVVGGVLLLAGLAALFNLDLLRGWLVEHFRFAAELIGARAGG